MNDITEAPLLVAARGGRPSRTPVWFMRQAGRSLPEYRKLREGTAMLDACMRPGPGLRDHAAAGAPPRRGRARSCSPTSSCRSRPRASTWTSCPAPGRWSPSRSRTASDVKAIPRAAPRSRCGRWPRRSALLNAELGDVPLIGFAGAPFTLASYLVEGGPSKHHERTKALMYGDPRPVARAAATGWPASPPSSCGCRSRAGVKAVQLFDSWAGALSERDYREFVLPHSTQGARRACRAACRASTSASAPASCCPRWREAGADVVGVDWRTPLDVAVERLREPRRTCQAGARATSTRRCCSRAWPALEREIEPDHATRAAPPPGHIFNLGHGVLPDTDPDVLTRAVELVHRCAHERRCGSRWSAAGSPASPPRTGCATCSGRGPRSPWSSSPTGWAASCAPARSAGAPTTWARRRSCTAAPRRPTLVAELGLADRLVHPTTAAASIRAAGDTRPIPAQHPDGCPRVGRRRARRPVARGPAPRSSPNRDLPPIRLDGADVAVGALLRERFGHEVVDRLVEPLLGGVYAGRADLLGAARDHAAAGRRAGLRRRLAAGRRRDHRARAAPTGVTRPPVFGTLRDGLTPLVDRLARGRRRGQARPAGARAGPPRARLAAGDRLRRRAASTWTSTAWCSPCPRPPPRSCSPTSRPAASRRYAEVELASMAVVALALPPGTELPERSGVLLAEGERAADGCRSPSRRPPSPAASGRTWPATPVLVRGSVGRHGEAHLLQRDDDELVAAVRHDLRALTGVTAEPVDTAVTRWGGGLPQYGVGPPGPVARPSSDAVADAARPGRGGRGATTASASPRASPRRTRRRRRVAGLDVLGTRASE